MHASLGPALLLVCRHTPGLQLVGTFRVKRGVKVDVVTGRPVTSSSSYTGKVAPDSSGAVVGFFDEAWYQKFYGTNYYHIYDPVNATHQRIVTMEEYKGTGSFLLLVLEDWYPIYDHRDGKGLVNVRMYDLKHMLRTWVPRQYQVHASQTYEEGIADLSFLLGNETRPAFRRRRGVGHRGREDAHTQMSTSLRFFEPGTPLVQAALLSSKQYSRDRSMHIVDVVYVDSFETVLVPLPHGANAVQAQMLQVRLVSAGQKPYVYST